VKLFKIAASTALVSLLSGCLSLPSAKDLGPSSHYVINPQNGAMCQATELGESTGSCYVIAVISGSLQYLRPIEKAYGTEIPGPNYPAQLIRAMVAPAAESYSVSRLSNGAYLLPQTSETDLVWDSLEKIEKETQYK